MRRCTVTGRRHPFAIPCRQAATAAWTPAGAVQASDRHRTIALLPKGEPPHPAARPVSPVGGAVSALPIRKTWQFWERSSIMAR